MPRLARDCACGSEALIGPFSQAPAKKNTMPGRLSVAFQPGGKWTIMSRSVCFVFLYVKPLRLSWGFSWPNVGPRKPRETRATMAVPRNLMFFGPWQHRDERNTVQKALS